jgi:hypothetical protein
MKLPQQLKKNVLNELEFVIKKMREEPDLAKKIYFYSAVSGALERATRFHLDNELLVAHAIMNLSYGIINDRINHLRMGDTIVPFPDSLLDQLIDSVSELKQAIEEDKATYSALEKIMGIIFVATGPGFYTRSFLDYVETQQRGREE